MSRFNADEIRRRVRSSIEIEPVVGWTPDAHWVDPPRSMRFARSRPDPIGHLWLWAVFDAKDYLIVYDPRADEYGLATKPNGRRLGRFMGFYGPHLATAIRSM